MNIKRLLAVQAAILEHPQELNMLQFMERKDCRTTACIAGWACTLKRRLKVPDFARIGGVVDFAETAEEWFGISNAQAQRLFYLHAHFSNYEHAQVEEEAALSRQVAGCWPPYLERIYFKALAHNDYERAAQIVAHRIDVFIRTKGNV